MMPLVPEPTLDVIAIGRSSVDLYGQQVCGRLEDMASFSKAVGGCPTNIAIGTARLGLKSGLITRVGDEHMGRYIREQCAREGVDVAGRSHRSAPPDLAGASWGCATTRPSRSSSIATIALTARSMRATSTRPSLRAPGRSSSPARIFRDPRTQPRAEPGDRLGEETWPQGRLRRGLSAEPVGSGRAWRRRRALYQIGRSDGAFAEEFFPFCDLIVGTEEELMIAGGADDPLAALKAVRARSVRRRS